MLESEVELVETLYLENEHLRVGILPLGGNLTSVFDKDRDKELMWQGDPAYWKYQDVVIFPLIGLPSGGYEAKGKTYQFRLAHGVARWETFAVESHTATELILSLTSNEETMQRYPYPFKLRLCYTLEQKKYTLRYEVSSLTDERIPYQIGAHAGFSTGGDEVVVKFDNAPPIYQYPYDGFVQYPAKLLAENGRLVLNSRVYDREKSLVLPTDQMTGCVVSRADGIKLHYTWKDATTLTIWGFAQGGQFLCVEPWWGICESRNTAREITAKEQIFFAGKEKRIHTYSCEVV